MTNINEWFGKALIEVPNEEVEADPLFAFFKAGWDACIQHEKDQLAKSLAEFDNDNNDCGSGGCIL